MQAAAFADLVGRPRMLEWIRGQFKTVYLAEMMAVDGGFPAELARTKPYGYSLFVLDAMAGVAQIASTAQDDLWSFELPDGRGMRKGMAFMFPYLRGQIRLAVRQGRTLLGRMAGAPSQPAVRRVALRRSRLAQFLGNPGGRP